MGHDCIRTQDGVLLTGGVDSEGRVRGESLVIDRTNGQIETVGSLNVARWGHRMVEYQGRVLVLGGYGGMRALDSIEEWLPETKGWLVTDWTLTQPRKYFAVINVPYDICD